MVGIIIGVVFAVIIIALVIWIMATYNKLIRMRNNVEEGFSTMDVYLKKRYDLIPNYVETVKGYAKHERKTLTDVIAARNACVNASTPEDRVEKEGAFQGLLKQLAVVIEKYPELKADSQFIELQNTLRSLENEIASSRKYYNGVVKVYNIKREVFPSNIVAKMFKFEKKPLYEVDNAEERKNVKVEF